MQTAPGKRKATRGEWLQEFDPESVLLNLPDLGTAADLVAWLMEAGPVENDGPLSWPGLESWARRTGVQLDEWSAVVLIEMSRAYYAMRREAQDENYPPPFAPPKTAAQEKQLARRLSGALHAAAAARHDRGKTKK